MAIDMPLIYAQSVFAAKAESTTGTAETLAAADAALNVFDAEITDESGGNERRGQSAYSRLTPVAGARRGTARFVTELVGQGGSGLPAWATILLPAAGFVATGSTYSPVSGGASAATLTMAKYEDGRRRIIYGAMGDWTLTGTPGARALMEWAFTGCMGDPSDVALLTPTYPTTLPPVVLSATFTIATVTYSVRSFRIAAGNQVVLREDVTTASGYKAAVITDRNIRVTVLLEADLVATINWTSGFRANTTYALSCVVGSAANNIMTLTAPKLALVGPPRAQNVDGILCEELEFQAVRSAAAGDDELTLAFS